mmetsp:Transcript_19598/g.55125  ORF Transcript_19598/g.55125 Transcript_19598/m.55125 type:complete len:251 (+) Transcript_19598:782-1534(+)
MRSRRAVVHLCPAVPIAAKTTDGRATLRSASSMTVTALLPPSSRMLRPKRPATVVATSRPMAVLPVKEINGRRPSDAMAFPTSAPPQHSVAIPPSYPFSTRTSAIIFCVAIDTKFVDGAPFQIWVFPQTRLMEAFQPATALGKLNAVIIPMAPRGFQVSRRAWSGRSLGTSCPGICRERPTASSHVSTTSWTSPIPSALILPISSVTSLPRGSSFSRNRFPICLTTSPRFGAGVLIHSFLAAIMRSTHRL